MQDSPTLAAAEALFRSLDREVWIVTAGKPGAPEGLRGGLLATWVMQSSLAPDHPALLLGIAPNHHTASVIDHEGAAAAHLLRDDQAALAIPFADGSGRQRDKLTQTPLATSAACDWAPVLADCYGWFAGPVTARLDAGDRLFYWLDVQQAKYSDADETAASQRGNGPLRESQLLASASPDQLQRLGEDRRSDIELQAPLREQWLQRLRAGESRLTTK